MSPGMLTHRYDAKTVARNHAQGYWNAGSLWETASRHPAADLALIDGNDRWSWGDLRRLAEAAATRFADLGLRRGDLVGVQLPNSAHLVITILALLRLGAVYHPLNVSYRHGDLSRIFASSRPRAYIHPVRFRGFDYTGLAALLPAGPARIAIDLEAAPGFPCADGVRAQAVLPAENELAADDVFLVGATSGSTGSPKLFVHTQNTQKNEGRILNRELGLTAGDRFLATAPLTHRGALMFGFITALVAGASLVVLREYRPDEVLEAIDRHGITAFMAIPAQVSDLLELIERRPGTGRTLRVIMLSGAPVQSSLVQRLRLALPHCTPVTGYGTSETGYTLFTRPDDDLTKLQTCGRPMPGMELRIAEDGEILLRGAFVFSGYHDDPRATADALDSEGWFHTGDLGHLDRDGYLLVTGRKKNVIIRSGLKIQCEEIEQLVSTHPAVRQCALTPVPDDRLGERAALVVVSKDERALTLAEILGWLEQRGVAKFKWPEALVQLDALPLNPVGKLDRDALRRIASDA